MLFWNTRTWKKVATLNVLSRAKIRSGGIAFHPKLPLLATLGSEDIAVLMPVTPTRHKTRRTKTRADYDAFRTAAGGWKGLVDTDKLITDIYESRRLSTKPPIEL